jgi:hypothetical protein
LNPISEARIEVIGESMSERFVIRWVSKVNGRAGRGTKQFSREQAQKLVQELNAEYPQIQHEVVAANADEGAERPARQEHEFITE